MTLPKLSRSKELTSNITDESDEFDWYTPVAVILKPASQKEFKKRLQEDDGNTFFPFQQYQHQASSPFWSPFQDPWDFHPRFPYPLGEEDDDGLSDFYNSYELPESVQGKLLSLARLGLVAIPREEIGPRSSGWSNTMNREGEGNMIFSSS